MYSRPIVKDDFEVPKELVTKNFLFTFVSNPRVPEINSEIPEP